MQLARRAEVEETPLDRLDVSRAERFRDGTHHAVFARLRREDPVHFCAESAHGPYWSITRYDDILAVSRDHRRFSSQDDILIGDVLPGTAMPSLIATDPPAHAPERCTLMRALSPERLARLEGPFRARTAAVLDALPVGKPVDWVARVADELSVSAFAALLGIPTAEHARLLRWARLFNVTPRSGGPLVDKRALFRECLGVVRDIWQDRARNPQDDVISDLAHDPDTAALARHPLWLAGTMILLMSGGIETVRSTMTGSVLAVDREPGAHGRLRAAPGLPPNAVAEMVRWQTPVAHFRRTATVDVELHGKRIRRGERVVMWHCSGNRDEAQFPEPHRLILDRANAVRQLGFGFGIHRCPGKRVAEMQLRVLWEEILARFQRIEVIGEPRRLLSNQSAGYEALTVSLHS